MEKITFTDNMKFKPTSKNREYSCLSNHYVSVMKIDDKEYNHIEGFYYASMCKSNEEIAERIRKLLFPTLCKKVANDNLPDEDKLIKWNESFKVIVMKRAVYTKFVTNSDLAKVLISTGDATLVYDKEDDNYWGNGKNNNGENKLGKVLEEVRDVLNDFTNIDNE